MLVIRLARTGRTKYPTYRIVAAESARAATGKFIAVLGHYNPHTKELVMDREEVSKRLSEGAQPSNTVVKLLMREKMELPKWVKLQTKEPKKTEAPEAQEAPAAEAPAASAEPAESEAPAEAPVAAEEGERVAELNEEAAAATGDNATDIDHTNTAADEEKAAEQAAE